MTRSLKKVVRAFDTVSFLYNLYLCPLVVTELLYEKNHCSISINHAEKNFIVMNSHDNCPKNIFPDFFLGGGGGHVPTASPV